MGDKSAAPARLPLPQPFYAASAWMTGLIVIVAGLSDRCHADDGSSGVPPARTSDVVCRDWHDGVSSLPRVDYRITSVLGQPNERETMTNRSSPTAGFSMGASMSIAPAGSTSWTRGTTGFLVSAASMAPTRTPTW